MLKRGRVRYRLVVPICFFLSSIIFLKHFHNTDSPEIIINILLASLVLFLMILNLKRERDYFAKSLIVQRQQQRLEKREREMNVIFNCAPSMIWFKDAENRILRANHQAAASMGLSVQEVEGASVYDLYPEHAKKYHDDDLEVIHSGRPKFNIVEPYHRADGRKLCVSTDKIPYRDGSGNIRGVIVFATDITDLKHAQESDARQKEKLRSANRSLRKTLSTDHLTGLLNRRGLSDGIRKIVKQMSGGRTAYAILLDLDNFKDVNHAFGFVVGDMEIKRVGVQLSETIRESDLIGRIGGDEYMILLPNTDEDGALAVAEKIRLAVSEMHVGMSSGKSLKLTASIGLVAMSRHSTSLEELIERTYFALSQCKDYGKNTVNYNGKIGVRQTESGKILSSMIKSNPANNSFYPLKQSINRLSDHEVTGYELLIRLRDPHYGMPKDFFRLALESKVLTFIDRLCLHTCISGGLKIQGEGSIHLNLFPSTIIQIPATQLLEEFPKGCNLSRFCIEISEQQIIGDPSNLIRQVDLMKRAGLKVALDDVGFGSSCLESLIMLEPDIVKIDMAVVKGISTDKEKVRNLRKLISVIKACGATAIAEGIENRKDFEIVKSEGVPLGQGYLFSKPSEIRTPFSGRHVRVVG